MQSVAGGDKGIFGWKPCKSRHCGRKSGDNRDDSRNVQTEPWIDKGWRLRDGKRTL